MSKTKCNVLLSAMILIITVLVTVTMAYGAQSKKTLHIAYIEGDPYINYAGHLRGFTEGLSALRLAESTDSLDFKDGSSDAKPVWDWLSKHSSKDLVFEEKEFYQMVDMSDKEKKAFIKKLKTGSNIDLVIVMGTAAGTFMKESGVKTDMMIMSVTDARGAGIIAGQKYSGIENVWAHTSPNRYYNQLKVFQRIFNLKSLGIVYEDSENGRKEISYDVIKRFVREKGIKLVEAKVKADLTKDGAAKYEEKMIKGYQSMAGKVDGVYMTNCGSRIKAQIQEYVGPLYRAGIPVFSQTGKEDVEGGAMMMVDRYNFNEIGDFCAKQFAQIVRGKAPGSVPQTYDESQAICINMKAAQQANIKIPFNVLLSADIVYTNMDEGQQ